MNTKWLNWSTEKKNLSCPVKKPQISILKLRVGVKSKVSSTLVYHPNYLLPLMMQALDVIFLVSSVWSTDKYWSQMVCIMSRVISLLFFYVHSPSLCPTPPPMSGTFLSLCLYRDRMDFRLLSSLLSLNCLSLAPNAQLTDATWCLVPCLHCRRCFA